MCMKYVNVAARCYKSIALVDNNVMSYNIPFTNIQHDVVDGQIAVGSFVIITNVDILGTGKEEHKTENPLESGRTLDFIIRLTKCSNEEDKRIGYDLDHFSINLCEMYETGQVSRACFDFFNYTRTTNVDKVFLPGGKGKYVIKILIKDSEDENYTIQEMLPLTIV